jgi:hypothetical protein
VKVWQDPQALLAKSALPAAASPAGTFARPSIVPVAASLVGSSRPKTSTAAIIARKNATQTTR